MDIGLALVFLATCAVMVSRLYFCRDLVDLHIGVLGVFALGYYPLPVLFKGISSLRYTDSATIFEALLIHWVFVVSLLAGAFLLRAAVPVKPLRLPHLDALFLRWQVAICALAFGVFVTYAQTQQLTSYSAEDFEQFFQDRGPFFAIVAALAGLSQAIIATSLAGAVKNRRPRLLALFGSMFLMCVGLTIFLGQRLIILTPLVMLLAALYSDGQRKWALRMLVITVTVLIVSSPVVVFLRNTRAGNLSSSAATSTVSGFSFGDNAFGAMLQSVIDRSDLIYVTATMKEVVDAAPAPGLLYYRSVLQIPVPKLLLADKPYLLSDNGLPEGEMSIWAWKTMVGGTGSLTAFGGLVAYREGGWLGVVLNGLATGLFFAVVARWLGGGGLVARMFYAVLFVDLAIAKVPPSFFEALAAFMGLLPFILAAIAMSAGLRVLQGFGATHARHGAA